MGWRIVVVIGIGFCLGLSSVQAQPGAKPEALSIPAIEKRIKAIQENAELSPSLKESAVSYLQRSIDRLQVAQEAIENAEDFEGRLPNVADAMKALQKRLSQLPTSIDSTIANEVETEELEKLVEARQKLLDDPENGLRKKIAALDQEAELRRVRPEQLATELAEVEERVRQIDEEVEGLTKSSGESREVLQAHQIFMAARRMRAEAERRELQAESDWCHSDAVAELLQAQRELAQKTLTLKTAELELLQNELAKRRGTEADIRVNQAETVVAQTREELKPVANQNVELAKEQRDLTDKLHEVEQSHEANTTRLTELNNEFERTREIVEQVGLSDSIGLLLRQHRAKLPDPRQLRSNISHRSDAVREIRMRLFQLDVDRNTMIDLDEATAKRAEEIILAKDSKALSAKLKALLSDQRQLLNGLENDYTKYFAELVEMDILEKQLLELTTKYIDYVDERVLWIRTGQSYSFEHLRKAIPSLTWVADRKLWQSVVDAVYYDYARRPIRWIIVACAFVSWFVMRPLMKSWIHRSGEIAAEINCRDMLPTVEAMITSLILALGWPSLIYFVGWQLDHVGRAAPFVHAVATGLLRAATFAFPLEVLRVICLRGGLAERHFDWDPRLTMRWRRNLTWFLPLSLILVGTLGLIEGTTDEQRRDSFGRATFLAFAALSTIFSLLTIRRASNLTPTSDGSAANDVDVWSNRFWQYAPRLAIAVCVGLLALTWSGYFYTALQLTWRLQRTAIISVGLLLVRAGIRRWIALERRRMAVLQEAELQSIASAGREPGTASHNPFLFPSWRWPEFRLNLTQIVTQMRSLLDTGLLAIGIAGMWFVWADVTPALNILNRYTLWETPVDSVETTTEKDGAKVTRSMHLKKVTAADLGLAIVLLGIAFVAGRNIPGLVEVILLEHLSVDAGIRFAVTSLVRYVIVVAGACFAFAQVGLGWSNVQWLVAAASVGLGFGLQEIFCNFVSGIILLFERPMRVGDVITIGDTTGTISRIRFRATTILDGDRKELIVPNKDFITGKLLNWTLSDCVNRVAVKVMVSGNSDPQHVRRILLDVAAQHPLLLKEPSPSATLEDLNGGLTFMLRAFLPSLEGRSTAIHELYTQIHDRLQAEGIEMPCPSQEVFVRMDRNEAVSSAPPAPHQAPPGVPLKQIQAEFGTAYRRA